MYNAEVFVFNPNANNLVEGNIDLKHKNGVLYFETNLVLKVTAIGAFGEALIGTIPNWILNYDIAPICILQTLGYDTPVLGLKIKSNGEVYVFSHYSVTGIDNKWYYGFSSKIITDYTYV